MEIIFQKPINQWGNYISYRKNKESRSNTANSPLQKPKYNSVARLNRNSSLEYEPERTKASCNQMKMPVKKCLQMYLDTSPKKNLSSPQKNNL